MARQHCNGERRRSRHPHLRLVDCEPPTPPPTREDIAKACLQVANVARGCAVDLGTGSDHGRWFTQLAEQAEREAEAVANQEEE